MKRLAACLTDTLNGNSNAFNDVVRQYQEEALRKASHRLKSYALAEEAVQEAFLAAYLNLPSLRKPECFPAWFRSILISCICRSIKTNHLNIAFTDLNESGDLHQASVFDLEAFEYRQTIELVRRAIRKLEPKDRRLCTSFYLHEYSLREVADSFDIPVGTVKRRLHEARRQIAEHVQIEDLSKVIRVGYLPISDHLLAMISHQMHHNDRIRIELQRFLSWQSLVHAIRRGWVDVAFIMATLALGLKNEGVSIRHVLDAGHGGSAITVRNSIASVRALCGTRLGLPLANSTHHALLHIFLKGEAISVEQDISAIYLGPSFSIGALKKHRIDGFFCAEPWNTKAVCEGIGRTLIRSEQIAPGHVCCIVVVSHEFAQNRGDILQSYLKQLLAARDLIRSDPEKCSIIQGRYTGIHPHIAEHVLRKGYVTFSDLKPDKQRLTETMKMALSTGILDRPCNLDEFISTDFQ